MDNKNLPAFPVRGADGRLIDSRDEQWIEQCMPAIGLTKRELAAFMALQGLMANIGQLHGSPQEYGIGKLAVACADEVLAELNKQPAPTT